MLEVDFNEPNPRLKRSIMDTCAAFGPVRSVKVHRQQSPFAVIEMTDPAQTIELAGKFGGSTFGTSALIHLTPKSS